MAPTYNTLIDGEINWLLMVTGKKTIKKEIEIIQLIFSKMGI